MKRRLLVALLLGAVTAQAQPEPPEARLLALSAAMLDSVAAARAVADQAAGNGPAASHWSALLRSEAERLAGNLPAAAQARRAAEDTLLAVPVAARWHGRLRLGIAQAPQQLPADRIAPQLALARQQPAGADAASGCTLAQWQAETLLAVHSHNEAFVAAHDYLHCAMAAGSPVLQADALGLAALARWHADPAERPRATIEALKPLAQAQARLQTLPGPKPRLAARLALAEGEMLLGGGQPQAALRVLHQAEARAAEASDPQLLNQTRLALAQAHVAAGQLQAAQALLVQAPDATDPTLRLQSLRLHLAAQPADPQPVLAAAEALDLGLALPQARADLALAIATRLARDGHWAPAYERLQQADRLDTQAQALARDWQIARLHLRHDRVRAQGELADLRARAERDRSAGEAVAAQDRVLWAASGVLGLWLLVGAGVSWRLWRRRRELAALALRDELTGAPNRRAVLAYAQAQQRQAARLGTPLTLGMIDLDHFKRLNDSLGHAVGDAALQAFYRAAAQVLRGQDRLGRWGGEEWLLVLPGTAAHEVGPLFDRLRRAYAAMGIAGAPEPHGCTFSMGVAAVAPQQGLHEALETADRALYAAKAAGRDRLMV